MDDDDFPRRRDDVLAALARQPLDPLSVDELSDRIAALEAEAERTRRHLAAAGGFKANAEALFRKSAD
jgi:uncharacterized small protein (DUF1192 family)